MEKRIYNYKNKFYDEYARSSYEVINHTFDSLFDYVTYLKKQKTAEYFSSSIESEKTNTSYVAWCGTKSLEDAYSLCVNGEYDSAFDDFDHERQKLEKELDFSRDKSKTKRDVIGFAPNVPAYLMGLPKDMYNISKSKKQSKKVIHIYYNISSSAFVEPNQMRNRGICALTFIKELESQGFAVSLHLFHASQCDGQILYTEWNVKNEAEAINYRSLYFPMVNPSFLRRLYFKLIESTEELSQRWVNGYGTPCEIGFTKQLVNSNGLGIVINQPHDHRIKGDDIVKDYSNFVESVSSQLKNCISKQEKTTEREM